MFGRPLTDSWFPGGDGENGLPVTATDAHTWPTMANAETNGETENARNVGQLGTWGNGCAVNKLRGKRCRGRIWLPERNTDPNTVLESPWLPQFSKLLTPMADFGDEDRCGGFGCQ